MSDYVCTDAERRWYIFNIVETSRPWGFISQGSPKNSGARSCMLQHFGAQCREHWGGSWLAGEARCPPRVLTSCCGLRCIIWCCCVLETVNFTPHRGHVALYAFKCGSQHSTHPLRSHPFIIKCMDGWVAVRMPSAVQATKRLKKHVCW